MRIRTLILTVMCLCMIGGLVAGVFSHSIETALTLQSINGARQSQTGTPAPTHTKTPGSGSGTGHPVATTTPMPNGVNVLAKDTFLRTAQTFWGKASDGRLWAGDANSIEVFSIVAGVGQIDHGQGAFNAVLGLATANAEALVSASANQFANGGKVNIGVVLRWADANNWYKALIDGAQLQILRNVNGVITPLASLPFQAKGGVTYSLRFRAVGANLFFKAWQSNQPEPAQWMLTAADTMLTQGMGGVRLLVQNTSVILVTSFLETTVGAVA